MAGRGKGARYRPAIRRLIPSHVGDGKVVADQDVESGVTVQVDQRQGERLGPQGQGAGIETPLLIQVVVHPSLPTRQEIVAEGVQQLGIVAGTDQVEVTVPIEISPVDGVEGSGHGR